MGNKWKQNYMLYLIKLRDNNIIIIIIKMRFIGHRSLFVYDVIKFIIIS